MFHANIKDSRFLTEQCAVLNMPEWPAAELLLRTFTLMMRREVMTAPTSSQARPSRPASPNIAQHRPSHAPFCAILPGFCHVICCTSILLLRARIASYEIQHRPRLTLRGAATGRQQAEGQQLSCAPHHAASLNSWCCRLGFHTFRVCSRATKYRFLSVFLAENKDSRVLRMIRGTHDGMSRGLPR